MSIAAATLSLSLVLGAAPPEFVTISSTAVRVDGRAATLHRSHHRSGQNARMGGEHVSWLMGEDGRVLGHVQMTLDMAAGASLPSESQARQVAMQVLEQYAPDLRHQHRVHWVRPHDETITVQRDGQAHPQRLTGMKVKMRATSGSRLWFWVIVGPGQQVMAFERDIVWVTMPGHRSTEQWLHDDWLIEQAQAHRGAK